MPRKGDKIDRTGEIHITKQGYNAKIIEYINANNCTVEFDDGTIVYNKSYIQLKSKSLRKPTNRLGEKHLMNDGHEVEIIEYKNAKNLVISYKDGTLVKNRTYDCLLKGSIMKPFGRVGEKHITNQGYELEIIEYFNAKNCTVKFGENQIVKNKIYTSIKKGSVDNPYHKSVFSIGYVGVGEYPLRENGRPSKSYSNWAGMLQRCYDDKNQEKYPTYKDCYVTEEWHNFQNFAEWYYNNWKSHMDKGWCLDKDILIKGNKIYSPETCCFVPSEINNLFVKSNNSRGEYPIGVHFDKEKLKFIAQIRRNNKPTFLGTFDIPEEAFQDYKTAKEEYIKEIADKWKGQISEQVYQSMYKYQVEITD